MELEWGSKWRLEKRNPDKFVVAIMTKTKFTNFPKVAQRSFSVELLD
jgi:hypothetical protein